MIYQECPYHDIQIRGKVIGDATYCGSYKWAKTLCSYICNIHISHLIEHAWDIYTKECKQYIASMYHTEFIQVLGRIPHCKVFVGYNPTALRINTDY
ncbi:hypothetical protein [Prevotella sp. P4-98]|uniref:hypothetical protein n=1 Tax=Prevotella sp. P4-98 TaxID=2024219 RepID=UPI0011804A82|nr:hypothetical protein [Prevotella sp. P4-98]